jgi:hypothetical protein
MNKNKSKKLSNREVIKNNILKGKEYYTHSGNLKSAKKPNLNFLCSCDCAKRFSEKQIKDVFNNYYSQKSRKEQNLFLNSLVIPVTNDQNIRQKFDYFIEVKNPKNEVFLYEI